MKYIKFITLTILSYNAFAHAQDKEEQYKTFKALQRINSILTHSTNPLEYIFDTLFFNSNRATPLKSIPSDLNEQAEGLFFDKGTYHASIITPWGKHIFCETSPATIIQDAGEKIYKRLEAAGVIVAYTRKVFSETELERPQLQQPQYMRSSSSPHRYAITAVGNALLSDARELSTGEHRSAEVIQREWQEFMQQYQAEKR